MRDGPKLIKLDLINEFIVQCGDSSRQPFPTNVEMEIDSWLTAAPSYSSRSTTNTGGATATSKSVTSTGIRTISLSSISTAVEITRSFAQTLASSSQAQLSPAPVSTARDPSDTIVGDSPSETPSTGTDPGAIVRSTIVTHTSAASSSSLSSLGTSTFAAQQASTPTLSSGAIAGTAIGGAAAFSIIIGLLLYFLQRKRNRNQIASPRTWAPDRIMDDKKNDESDDTLRYPHPTPIVRSSDTHRMASELHSNSLQIPYTEPGGTDVGKGPGM